MAPRHGTTVLPFLPPSLGKSCRCSSLGPASSCLGCPPSTFAPSFFALAALLRYPWAGCTQDDLPEEALMSNRNTAMPVPSQDWDEEQQEQFSILRAFLITFHHFFGDFGALFQSVDDPRHPELIIYPPRSVGLCRSLDVSLSLGRPTADRPYVSWKRPLRDQVSSSIRHRYLCPRRYPRHHLWATDPRPGAVGCHRSGQDLDSQEGAGSLPPARLVFRDRR
jgi:hypothetical protein